MVDHSITPNNLRSLYQQQAALFLHLSNIRIHTNTRPSKSKSTSTTGGDNGSSALKTAKNNGETRSTTSTPELPSSPPRSTSNTTHLFDPVRSSRSLILRSLYRNDSDATVIHHHGELFAKHSGNCHSKTTNATRKKRKLHVETVVKEDGRVVHGVDEFRRILRRAYGCTNGDSEDTTRAEGSGAQHPSGGSDPSNSADTIGSNIPIPSLSLFSPLALDSHRNAKVGCDYYCTTCGVPYLLLGGDGENQQPPPLSTAWNPTTVRIRTIQRGRTRRRRASRKKASDCIETHDRQSKHRGGGRSFSNTAVVGNAAPTNGTADGVSHGAAVMELAQIRSSLRDAHGWRTVGDGVSKNCVVYTCGFCGTKRRWKGGLRIGNGIRTEQPKNCRGGGDGPKGITMGSARRKHTDHTSPVETVDPSEHLRTNTHQSSTEDDFLKLDDVTDPKYTLLRSTKTRKKRKRNAVEPKKSGLMDFLSSLND